MCIVYNVYIYAYISFCNKCINSIAVNINKYIYTVTI